MKTSNRSAAVVRRAPVVRAEAEIVEHPPLPPGLHLAPFLHAYSAGGFVLLAIDRDGALAGMFNVTAGNGHATLDVYTGRGSIEEQRQNIDVNDIDLVSNIASVREFPGDWWAPGLHLAPWKPRFLSAGVVVVGIARNGQLWGIQEAPKMTPAFLADARDMLALSDEEGSGGLRSSIIDYSETEAIKHGEHGRLLRIESAYKQDREEYGRLIGVGVEHDSGSGDAE